MQFLYQNYTFFQGIILSPKLVNYKINKISLKTRIKKSKKIRKFLFRAYNLNTQEGGLTHL